MIKRIIWWTLKKMGLSIKKEHPSEFVRFAKDYFNNREIIGAEVGVQHGVNAKYMFKLLNIKKLYLIDFYKPYEDWHDGRKIINDFASAKEVAIKNIKKWKEKSNWIYKDSTDALSEVPNELDFVYIDSNHSYDFVKKDIENYWSKIKRGGIIGGCAFSFYSVAKAVVEFAEKNDLEVITKAKDWEWIIKKK